MSKNQRKDQWVGGLVLLTGAIIGAATTLFIKESRPMKASEVLLNTKAHFEQDGKIIGSWIDYDPVEYTLFDNAPLAYIGGVTLETSDGTRKHLQFACDIYTGDIIDTFQTNIS